MLNIYDQQIGKIDRLKSFLSEGVSASFRLKILGGGGMSKHPSLEDTGKPKEAQASQHKIKMAFSFLERNNLCPRPQLIDSYNG